MLHILNLKETYNMLENSKWELLFHPVVITTSINGYFIFAVRKRSGLWFSVDYEPLHAECYIYTSNNLVDCCDWLSKEVGEVEFLYY